MAIIVTHIPRQIDQSYQGCDDTIVIAEWDSNNPDEYYVHHSIVINYDGRNDTTHIITDLLTLCENTFVATPYVNIDFDSIRELLSNGDIFFSPAWTNDAKLVHTKDYDVQIDNKFAINCICEILLKEPKHRKNMTKEELLKNFDIDFVEDSMGKIFAKFDNWFDENYPYQSKYPKPRLNSSQPSVEELDEYREKHDLYNKLNDEYEKTMKIRKEVSNTIDSIKEEMIREESGLNNIPEKYREKVYSLAWSNGHSDGYISVYNHLCELVEIFN